jgi:uncharacterized protein Yka (UPF0111/DUF47 family)
MQREMTRIADESKQCLEKEIQSVAHRSDVMEKQLLSRIHSVETKLETLERDVLCELKAMEGRNIEFMRQSMNDLLRTLTAVTTGDARVESRVPRSPGRIIRRSAGGTRSSSSSPGRSNYR